MKTPDYAIFCEDVREEVDGKSTFVGVHFNPLTPPKFPIRLLRLAVLFRVEQIGPIPTSFEVRISFPNDDEPFTTAFPAPEKDEVPEGEAMSVFGFQGHFVFNNLRLTKPGRLLAEGRFGQADFELLGALDVLDVEALQTKN